MTTLLTAIRIWGLASFVIVLSLNTFSDLRYRLGRYYSLAERIAWISTLVCFVAQFVLLALGTQEPGAKP
jgi:hypothetical protein